MYDLIGGICTVCVFIMVIGAIISKCKSPKEKTKEEIAHEIMEQELEKKRSQSPKWKCHRCGRSNPMYQTTCYCGQSKDQ